MTGKDILNANMLSEINISFSSTLYAFAATIVASLMLRNVYISHGRSMNNREYFGNIFILLSVTTCSVIIIVKYSLALSLGLVGALSIVRFRAAIKEPEELVYLFLTIAFGLSFGASQFAVGFTLLVVSLLVIIIAGKLFNHKKLASHTGILCVISGDRDTVVKYRRGELAETLRDARMAILKEFSLEGDSGRLVVKLSSGTEGEIIVDKIEQAVSLNGLDLNLISEISVVA